MISVACNCDEVLLNTDYKSPIGEFCKIYVVGVMDETMMKNTTQVEVKNSEEEDEVVLVKVSTIIFGYIILMLIEPHRDVSATVESSLKRMLFKFASHATKHANHILSTKNRTKMTMRMKTTAVQTRAIIVLIS